MKHSHIIGAMAVLIASGCAAEVPNEIASNEEELGFCYIYYTDDTLSLPGTTSWPQSDSVSSGDTSYAQTCPSSYNVQIDVPSTFTNNIGTNGFRLNGRLADMYGISPADCNASSARVLMRRRVYSIGSASWGPWTVVEDQTVQGEYGPHGGWWPYCQLGVDRVFHAPPSGSAQYRVEVAPVGPSGPLEAFVSWTGAP